MPRQPHYAIFISISISMLKTVKQPLCERDTNVHMYNELFIKSLLIAATGRGERKNNFLI